eukprot:2265867-Amphidinium_carterae.1
MEPAMKILFDCNDLVYEASFGIITGNAFGNNGTGLPLKGYVHKNVPALSKSPEHVAACSIRASARLRKAS